MPSHRPRLLLPLFCLATIHLAAHRSNYANEVAQKGDEIYSAKCARCHGQHGEGSVDYEGRLEGDLSIAQLAELIAETMPGDDPGALSSDEAQAVAAYVHGAFYSPIAAARNRPARVALARLTVRQYRRAVADLIGSFRGPMRWGDERGLRGDYFNSREPNDRNARIERRIDSQVNFDFGSEAPVPKIEEPRRYSIRWTGAVLAPETGIYVFIIRTDHATRLWVNDTENPVIDAWVKSGHDTEFKASMFLVGGRAYSLQLDFSKAKLGVDDSDKEDKKKRSPSPPASMVLLWQRPQGVAEPIPSRFLSPERNSESFICNLPFPPDDRSYGWVRGTAVSAAWDEATTNAAIQATGYMMDRINQLAGTREDANQREQRLRAFCAEFAGRAFRRPLSDELARAYVDRQFEESSDVDAATRRVLLLVLKSPRFLFREVDGGSDDYNTAARLSFGLWDSLPDERLKNAARAGELATDNQLRKQAERMLADLRAQTKLHEFLLTWLNVDGEVDLSKNPALFPEFDAAAIADMRTSLELFLDEVITSDAADYRDLLLCENVYLNDRLATLYGSGFPFRYGPAGRSSVEYTKEELDGGERAGVLTHPYIMARFSHRSETSPIHRGVFLARGILGQSLRPPPEAFTPLAPELHPDLTTRERVTLQTKDASCMSCHRIINPLGFTLEQFDAVGRFRNTENGKPVDSRAEYLAGNGTTAVLRGARDLAQHLASSDECQAAFVEQLFHHLVQQPVQAYGPNTLEGLCRSFAENNFNIRRLAVEIMVASARIGRETDSTSAAKN